MDVSNVLDIEQSYISCQERASSKELHIKSFIVLILFSAAFIHWDGPYFFMILASAKVIKPVPSGKRCDRLCVATILGSTNKDGAFVSAWLSVVAGGTQSGPAIC